MRSQTIFISIILTVATSCSQGPLAFNNSGSSSKKSEDVINEKPLVEDSDEKNALQEPEKTEEQGDIFPHVAEDAFSELDPAEIFEDSEFGPVHEDMIIDTRLITYWGKEKKGLFAAQESIIQNKWGLRSHPWPGGLIVLQGTDTTPSEMTMILDGCNEWGKTAKVTCKIREAEKDFVKIYHKENKGCKSVVGKISLDKPSNFFEKNGLEITRYLGDKFGFINKVENAMNFEHNRCNSKGTIIHEFGHLLGLGHEQKRPIRDSFVDIHEENIVDEKKSQFTIIDMTTYVTEKYDFKSIMHYGAYYFSKNGKKTLTPKPAFSEQEQYIGSRDYPSSLDRQLIEEIYGRKEVIPDNVQVIDSDSGNIVEYKPVVTNETKAIYRGHRSGNGHMWGRSHNELTSVGYSVDGKAFDVFKTPGPGRVTLYSCTFGSTRYFISTSSNCDGETLVGSLGYANTSSSNETPSLLYSCYDGFSHLVVKNTTECTNNKFDQINSLGAYVP